MTTSEFDLVLQPSSNEFHKVLDQASARIEELFDSSEFSSQSHTEPLEISFRLSRPLLSSEELDREFFVKLKAFLEEFESSRPRFTTVFGVR